MKRLLFAIAAGLAASVMLPPQDARARLLGHGLEAPALVAEAACLVQRARVVRPNGRVVYRTVTRCGPGIRPAFARCRVVRDRIVRPGGRVVVRTVRDCR